MPPGQIERARVGQEFERSYGPITLLVQKNSLSSLPAAANLPGLVGRDKLDDDIDNPLYGK